MSDHAFLVVIIVVVVVIVIRTIMKLGGGSLTSALRAVERNEGRTAAD